MKVILAIIHWKSLSWQPMGCTMAATMLALTTALTTTMTVLTVLPWYNFVKRHSKSVVLSFNRSAYVSYGSRSRFLPNFTMTEGIFEAVPHLPLLNPNLVLSKASTSISVRFSHTSIERKRSKIDRDQDFALSLLAWLLHASNQVPQGYSPSSST